MNISETFLSLPMVVKNNKDEDVKTVQKINPRLISSYYEAIHKHDNGDETVVTYINMIGRGDTLGAPFPVKEFEELLIPYLPILNEMGLVEYDFKDIPIRYKDVTKSELHGVPVYFDKICSVNIRFIVFYHPHTKEYDGEDVECVWFGLGADSFVSVLSIKEFETIIGIKK